MNRIKKSYGELINEIVKAIIMVTLFFLILGVFSCWVVGTGAQAADQMDWEFALDQKELAEPVDLKEAMDRLGCKTMEECSDYIDELGCTSDAACEDIYGE